MAKLTAGIGKLNKQTAKYEIISAFDCCALHGLKETTKWLAELSFSLDVEAVKPSSDYALTHYHDCNYFDDKRKCESGHEADLYRLAKSYFDVGEYKRAAYVVQNATSPLCYFLNVYSRYLAALQRQRHENINNHSIAERALGKNNELRILRAELLQAIKNGNDNAFVLYLYGIILKKTSEMSTSAHRSEAVAIFSRSIHQFPMNWGAWHELSTLVTDQQSMLDMDLPQHWMKDFFRAQTHVDLINAEEALIIYDQLKTAGFEKSFHIKTQEAIAHHNRREFDEAIVILEQVRAEDPYRLDDMDILSNMYYVKGRRADLAFLAHHCSEVDKYRVETCCIVGNYYSIRTNHDKAVLYFQRALKLNPTYLSAWTLMGHEYTEVKNTSAAIQAYRNAVDLNRRDYRAWYGLGQTYELLKMLTYALYYYKQAHRLRPFDSRMLMAVGETYEMLERYEEAKMCFRKAVAVGDIEGMANIKLAKLYKRERAKDWAALYYERYAQQAEERGVVEGTTAHTEAFDFLARHYLSINSLDAAVYYAHKCCEYADVQESGNAVLREISQKRAMLSADAASQESVQPTPSHVTQQHDDSVSGVGGSPATNVGPMKLSFSPNQAESDTSNIM